MKKIFGAFLLLLAMILSSVEFLESRPMEHGHNGNGAAPGENGVPQHQPAENEIPQYPFSSIESQLSFFNWLPTRDPPIYYYEDENGVHTINPGEYTVGLYHNFIRGIVIRGRVRRVLGEQQRPIAVGVISRTSVDHNLPGNIHFGETPENTPGMEWHTVIFSAGHRDTVGMMAARVREIHRN